MALDGELVAYWEQGWEGRVEFAFQVEGSKTPKFLQNGEHLTIFDEAGTTIWSGKIQMVPVRFWDRHRLEANVWSHQKQKGVSYGRWLAWFWQKPPLKARLE